MVFSSSRHLQFAGGVAKRKKLTHKQYVHGMAPVFCLISASQYAVAHTTVPAVIMFLKSLMFGVLRQLIFRLRQRLIQLSKFCT